MRHGFEDVDRDAESSGLVAYLDVMSGLEAVRDYRQRALTLLAPAPGERILEVGCGTGESLADLARAVEPGGRVAGVDASRRMIEAARARTAGLPVDLATGDAHALDFPAGCFDACRADRVFQHLDDPRRALSELVRVCRPGGRIVISEPDWETVTLDVPDRALARKVLAFLCDSVRHGWIGRQLPRLFRDAGLTGVTVEAGVLTLDSAELAEEALGTASAAVRAYEAGALTAEETARWLALLDESSRTQRFFASLTGFTVRGALV
jgi:ubiquinone/menaquinone biosynthesis C-methylase UbiE